MHCASYIDRMLEAHKWNSGHPNESQRANIEPLPASVVQQIDSEEGPTEHSPEAASLEKKMGFGFRNVLGELIYAYTICRLDIGYAVTKLARYSQAPAEIHY